MENKITNIRQMPGGRSCGDRPTCHSHSVLPRPPCNSRTFLNYLFFSNVKNGACDCGKYVSWGKGCHNQSDGMDMRSSSEVGNSVGLELKATLIEHKEESVNVLSKSTSHVIVPY
jgi:hypothetical protein